MSLIKRTERSSSLREMAELQFFLEVCLRDARDIENRVKRMFGIEHPFANYKKFLKGLREGYIKSRDEFNA